MDPADCPDVNDSLSEYQESDVNEEAAAAKDAEAEEAESDVDIAKQSKNIKAQVTAMDESEGEVEDDPPSNWGYEPVLVDLKSDAADVLADADAIINEDGQSSNQSWTNPGLDTVPDEMTAGTPL